MIAWIAPSGRTPYIITMVHSGSPESVEQNEVKHLTTYHEESINNLVADGLPNVRAHSVK